MSNDIYKHNKITRSFLTVNHFRYSREWSAEGVEAYITTFPIYKYHSLTILELRIVVYEDGSARIDVLESSNHGVYSPWYRNENYNRYPILREIDQKIYKIMTSMGFKKISKEKKIYGSKSNPYRSKQFRAGSKPFRSTRK